MGAGKERIPNRGQKTYKGHTRGSNVMKNLCMQDAPVRKPLAAVTGITHKGNVDLFDRKGSFIAPEDCPEVEEIRRLIRKIKQRIELEEEKGVYVMPFWVKVDRPAEEAEGADASVFSRLGR